jgi:glycosyltransferase involved in cell wall biosynthesis
VRILYLTINPNRVSTTVPTEGWFRFLRPHGLEPVLVSHEIGAFHAWANGEGIPSYHVPLPQPSKTNPFPFVTSLWRLLQIARRHRIELIHCNEQNCYPIGAYLARWTGLPIVVSVHFTIGRDFCQWAFGKRVPQRVFFVSEGNLRACREGIDGVVPQDRWRVLNNALDLSRYHVDPAAGKLFRAKYGLPGERVIGVACALRERKQIEHLVQVAKLLPNDVHVALAGGPVPEERGYAESLINDCNSALGSRFHYLGHLDDLNEFSNALDLFINTSREESFGIAAVEAMACGCPVIGYPSKAVDTVVLPGGGEITPQDDVSTLAKTIERWLGDPLQLAATRLTARARVESAFDIRTSCEQLYAEYAEILSAGHPAKSTATQRPTGVVHRS